MKKTYPQFLDSLTGTDPVADAREVRQFVHRSTFVWKLDMVEVFQSLLIHASSSQWFYKLHRSAKDKPFYTAIYAYEDLEACTRLVGLWVLNRHKSEVEDLSYASASAEDKKYIDAFTMELMVPEEALKYQLKDSANLHEIVESFGVTSDVLYRRMHGLGLL